MQSDEYINVVKEQLRAYDFGELTDEDIHEAEKVIQEEQGEDDLTSEEKEEMLKNTIFMRFSGNGVQEMVTIVELENNSVDEIKRPINILLDENEDKEIKQDDEVEESQIYYLFVADDTTKPLHTAVDRYTFERELHGVLSVLADMSDGEVYFKNDFSLFEHSPFLRLMSKNAEDYFAVSP